MGKANYLHSTTAPVTTSRHNSPGGNPNLEAVGRLASGVAHDFNNLLTGVLLYCDLIADELNHSGRRVPNRNKLRHAAAEIRTACERGTALIQQMLVVARPESAEPASVTWNDAALGMSDLLQRLVGEDIELASDLSTELKKIDLSPTRAQQIILNLVLNARDAMPKGGKIVLQTRNAAREGCSHRGYVELSVTDTGCGMDQQTLGHAFDPFFTTKPRGEGSGLGLANVQSIVSQAAGEVLIESQPGRGTRVRVRLPEGRVRESKAPTRSGRRDSWPGTRHNRAAAQAASTASSKLACTSFSSPSLSSSTTSTRRALP